MSDETGRPLIEHLASLTSRRIILFGGKGGVGKTTISAAAALHYAKTRPVILFTTDPASNLEDLQLPLRVESLDAEALYAKFLAEHIEAFLEIGDRGTYLDREELRRLLELALPGADELMAWMHIGELAEENLDAVIVVDTAPTGHTLRMLSSAEHFRQLALALDAMQEKHRAMVRQFTRRDPRDAIDAFIEEFDARAKRRHALLVNESYFVPVTLPEPLVIEQTMCLIEEVGLTVPFVILNRAKPVEIAYKVVEAPRACAPLDSAERIEQWSECGDGRPRPSSGATGRGRPVPHRTALPRLPRLVFLAGKGGVGKTSCSASIALQLGAVALSVDPSHSLLDLRLEGARIEGIDTKAKWRRFRESFGDKIESTIDALTPGNVSLGYDTEAMKRLIEMAPPGADELFAIDRISDLIRDESVAHIVIDTAPTGHFLRLLDLPKTAGEWVREFMRLLLKYKDLIPAGSLGEELIRASRALKEVQAALTSDDTAVIVVTRPERIVVAETQRLLANLKARGIRVGGVIANYVTPVNDDPCDQSMRGYELEALEAFDEPVVIERRERPPMTADELRALVPM
jgi:arsenite-transporting ATPase